MLSEQTLLTQILSLPNLNLLVLNLSYTQINKHNNPTSIQINYKEILSLIHIYNITRNQLTPQILLQINLVSPEVQLIQQTINLSTYQNQLTNLFQSIKNLHSNNLQFYTDASIKNIQTSNIQTGIGWICSNDISIKFNVASLLYPDSTRIELFSIITLLLTISTNSTLTIFLDSKIAIKNLSNTPSTKPIQNKN